MAERSDQRTRERSQVDTEDLQELLDTGPDVDDVAGDSTDAPRSADADSGLVSGLRDRLGSAVAGAVSRPFASIRSRLGQLFSVRTFGTALVASIVAAIGFGFAIPFVDTLGALVGIFAVGLGFGLVGDRRQYLELGLAGAATAVLGAVMEFLVIALAGRSDLVVLFGVSSGLLAAVIGHYVGRDLRSGLTRDI
ncbi:hypothetical protein [Halorhabdus sp. BNX81]|uniref:hypothetical protein n=1 Tax=Halorhabdus sp. BNX81 TaxID=2980181 RepID=UPI0023DD5AEE|nr:hypothetical protein [Halorhabdus sp. BNX81]WEL21624.1 putative membrane protein [Halorhabdus sp. BNX81]